MPVDPDARARAEDLRIWRSAYTDAVALDRVVPRSRTVVVGAVMRIRLDPGRSIEVTVEDGAGRLTAVWTGRTRLPGIEFGTGLRLSGTAAVGPDGVLRMRNPEYALVAEPYR